MADDYGPGIKRLNYYHGQFLQKDDFNDEQGYHKEMRYRHNAHLHTSGVVYGLIVTQTSDTEIEVSPGMALDSRGREIVRLEAKTKQINAPGDYTKYVVIEFDQKKTDQRLIRSIRMMTLTGGLSWRQLRYLMPLPPPPATRCCWR